MATQKYIVREGFNYRVRDDKGNEKVYSEGDLISLPPEIGDATHQLERVAGKDKAAE